MSQSPAPQPPAARLQSQQDVVDALLERFDELPGQLQVCARYVIDHPQLVPTRPSEEHLPLFVDGGSAPALGTELWLVPRHVCPTVNLAEEALVVAADGSYTIHRIEARSHDLLVD